MPPFIQAFIDRCGKRRSILLVLVGVGSLAVIWAFAQWATAPTWVPVHSGMPLETVAEVTAKLDDAKIAYRLEKGGAELRVADSDLARARVLLAQEGLPARSHPGFELFDQPAWGMTDFTQRVNYRRALEGELERTITQMRGVESAQVHLALHETSAFRRRVEKPSAASVFLRLRPGMSASRELVEGITYLVASSVGGLKGENVTVLDDTGRLLSAAMESGGSDVLTKRQLAFQQEVEAHLERKAEELVAQVVGAGNVNVRVSASVSFDRVHRTVQAIDPNDQAVLQEQRSEIVPGPNSEGAGSTVENTTYEITRRVETFAGSVGSVERLSVAVLVNDHIVPDGEGVRVEPRSAEELRRIEGLVRNAIGLDERRGDGISVVSVPFNTESLMAMPVEEGPGILALVQQFQRPVIGLLAVVLAFVLALQVVRALPRTAQPVPQMATAGGAGMPRLEDAEEELRLPNPAGEQEKRIEGRDDVSTTLAIRPDSAVRVVRAWMKD